MGRETEAPHITSPNRFLNRNKVTYNREEEDAPTTSGRYTSPGFNVI
jgi:hypothetical protein